MKNETIEWRFGEADSKNEESYVWFSFLFVSKEMKNRKEKQHIKR